MGAMNYQHLERLVGDNLGETNLPRQMSFPILPLPIYH